MKYAVVIPTWPLKRIPWAEDSRGVALLREAGYPVIVDGLSPHDRCRGYLAARALSEFPDCEAIIWIDDDIHFDLEHVERLCRSWESLSTAQPATLTGVYVCRHMAALGALALSFNPSFADEISFYSLGGIHQVSAHGFGFCITGRRVLEEMHAPETVYQSMQIGHPTVYRGWACWLPMVWRGEHLGEDRSFCARVNAQNLGKMYVDTRVCVDHAGWTVKQFMPTSRTCKLEGDATFDGHPIVNLP